MIYGLLADLLALVHLAFILFAVGGGFLALRWRWLPLLHLPTLAWALWIEASGGLCPLTPLENLWRRRAGQAGYGESFIEHYLLPLIYPPGLSREWQWLLAAGLLLLNLLAYFWWWRRRRNR